MRLPKRTPKDQQAKKDVPPGETKPAGPSIQGTLRYIDEKSIAADTEKRGLVRFRLLPATRFLDKDGQPMRDSLFKAGDQVVITFNLEDEDTALSVTMTAKGAIPEKAAEPAKEPTADPPTVVSDNAKDDDAPKLRRGIPPRVRQERAEREAEAASVPPPVTAVKPNFEPPILLSSGPDPFIAAAREAAANFTETLPDFIVQQHTTRYQSESKPPNWNALDLVTAEVVVTNGKEEYKKVSINGKAVKTGIEKTGAWSTGEFATTQQDILDPATDAKFTRRGDRRLTNREAVVYDYSVSQPNSHWRIVPGGSQSYRPPYKGVIWFDKQTKRVLRIEQRATNFPDDFEFNRVDMVLNYDFVRIGSKTVLLPVNSESIICQSASTICSRNVLNFRNYRKFGAETGITFEEDPPKE
ncbi:MAG: hypothetical protein JNM66_29060 [Bryobacterales bacterium]|nr:hypothetical protein [Bryobacterales bacterium]